MYLHAQHFEIVFLAFGQLKFEASSSSLNGQVCNNVNVEP